MHLKRFHYLNGRWLKSHKIVDFPVKDYDPTHYLAAVPCNTIQRYKELVEMGKPSSSSQESFSVQYPKIFKHLKNAIVVRHPLERLISVYRCVTMLEELRHHKNNIMAN